VPDQPEGIEPAPVPLPRPEDIPLDEFPDRPRPALEYVLRWLRTEAGGEPAAATFANYL
jgi:hypothetical protein